MSDGPNPERTKRQALKLAKHATTKYEDAKRGRAVAIRFAIENGASLRDIEDATGVPRATVARIADRAEVEA